MGEKVQNTMHIRERGLHGFALGRSFAPHGKPSLAIAPDGRPWTHHISSPLVEPVLMARICDSARQVPSGDAWAVAVSEGAPEMGAWLLGLFPGEREAIWREACYVEPAIRPAREGVE